MAAEFCYKWELSHRHPHEQLITDLLSGNELWLSLLPLLTGLGCPAPTDDG